MPINPDAVGSTTETKELRWSSKDSLLYALGVGAGHDPLSELAFTTENTEGVPQQALPTMAVVLSAGMGRLMKALGPFDQSKMLHASEDIELLRPLPAEGVARFHATISNIFDKGKAALVVFEKTAHDPETDAPWFRTRTTLFIRGEGGWGGDRGPTVELPGTPDEDPDDRVVYETRPEQALIYRLSGDRNPLHSNPAFSAKGGLPRPILHGLCTYGFAGRALLDVLCDGDATRFEAMSARFSSPVFPGDPLTIEIWRVDDGAATFRVLGSNQSVVLDSGTCRYRS